jgi:hypothetical protein
MRLTTRARRDERRLRLVVDRGPTHEPFGLVMIEAMACGTPVLAYRAGAVLEVTWGERSPISTRRSGSIQRLRRPIPTAALPMAVGQQEPSRRRLQRCAVAASRPLSHNRLGPGKGEGTACSLGRGRVWHAVCDHDRTLSAACCDYSGTVWPARRAGGRQPRLPLCRQAGQSDQRRNRFRPDPAPSGEISTCFSATLWMIRQPIRRATRSKLLAPNRLFL